MEKKKKPVTWFYKQEIQMILFYFLIDFPSFLQFIYIYIISIIDFKHKFKNNDIKLYQESLTHIP